MLASADPNTTLMITKGAVPLATVVAYGMVGSTTARVEESFIITVTVAGTLNFKWAQDVSNATATNVTAGSRLVATRLA